MIIDLPGSDAELVELIRSVCEQVKEVGAEISEGYDVGGDRNSPVPITSLDRQSHDLQHVFATRTREMVHMSEVIDDPVELLQKSLSE